MQLVASENVENISCALVEQQEVKDIIENVVPEMSKILSEKNGLGLAAPQVGIKKKFFIFKKSLDELEKIFFNASFVKDSNVRVNCEEGCLSYGYAVTHINTKRWKRIKVIYDEWDGEKFVKKNKAFTGTEAIVLQHEIEHCGNGNDAKSVTIFTK